MSAPRGNPTSLKLAALPRNAPRSFSIQPDAEARATLAAELGLDGLRKLRLEGEILPEGKRDWRLHARLGATVVQPCVVTGAPVTTRIDSDFARSYRAGFADPEDTEAEMPEDDSVEPLPDLLDLAAVMAEALALELPDYPRAPEADLGAAVFGPPGVAPMKDEDARPFAMLKGLQSALDRKKDGTPPD
jgi:uncharacterized metal-binding protein YceD (DUF177 family)